jgi:hypothetical protein
MKMDFRHADHADAQKLNVILWKDAMGDKPVPGDDQGAAQEADQGRRRLGSRLPSSVDGTQTEGLRPEPERRPWHRD